jgi:Transposase DDE domain
MREGQGNGVSHLACSIEEDMFKREIGFHKPHVKALSDLVACVLTTRSVNSCEWIEQLPRVLCQKKSKERFISRFLANVLVKPNGVMSGYAPELLKKLSENGETVVLMLDQSQVKVGYECLMVSVRIGHRALPVVWQTVKTEGAIGFETQKKLLSEVKNMVPEGISILLSADRFYGTANMIGLCQELKWNYRIRLKGNILLKKDGGELSTGDAAKLGITELHEAEIGTVITHIGIIHEAGHPEPWIIAMNEKPTKARTLDYGLIWGIEALFSDFKSRGFGITETHLDKPERIDRLILILAIACYWAVSTGTQLPSLERTSAKKSA